MNVFLHFALALALGQPPAPAESSPRPKAGQKAGQKTAGQNPPARKAASANPEGVPRDAKKISDYEWSHTDKDGKAWIYKKTPFSIAKLPDDRASAPPPAIVPMDVRDLGDSVEFARKTPFGVARWTKKKADFDAAEKAAWEAAAKPDSAASGATPGKSGQ
jgi:hypothetical protein